MEILSNILIVIFIVIALSHFVHAYLRLVVRKSGFSYIPLINGILGGVGFYISSNEVLSSLWWLPFIVDWGCLPLLIETIVFSIYFKKHDITD